MVTKRLPAGRRTKQTKIPPGPKREDYPNFWQWAVALGESIPESERYGLPEDGSSDVDHYVYGTPRRVKK
ncbi:MAG: hypothetical protein HY873_02700 [Chloroflexi bacterium]|nr:hypothetical protein [Chloroflexota bacterium]